MSKRCTHCGSYNTEVAFGNHVSRGIINAGRATLSLSGAIAMSVICPTTATSMGVQIWKNTTPGEFKGHYCCSCGKEF